MARQHRFRRLAGWLTAQRVAALLLGLLGLLVGFAGYLYHHCECRPLPNFVAGWEQEFEGFYANVSASLVTITITVLTIDWLNERRADKQLKAQLIREMGHPTDSGITQRAVQELEAHGWLRDGSLKGVYLPLANLQEAQLRRADLQKVRLWEANLQKARLMTANLQGAGLTGAKLQRAYPMEANLRGAHLGGTNLLGANLWRASLEEAKGRANLQGAYLVEANLLRAQELTDEQLVTAYGLRGATMPDDSHYDGRFNLQGDIKDAKRDKVNPNDPEAMAHFYGVPLEVYFAGQEWARENLPRLRREAGLEQEEAAETADAQQPKEPQSAAPTSRTLGSPVVPTQSLLSFTVRKLIGLFWPFGL
jgi:hypothetical protein